MNKKEEKGEKFLCKKEEKEEENSLYSSNHWTKKDFKENKKIPTPPVFDQKEEMVENLLCSFGRYFSKFTNENQKKKNT